MANMSSGKSLKAACNTIICLYFECKKLHLFHVGTVYFYTFWHLQRHEKKLMSIFYILSGRAYAVAVLLCVCVAPAFVVLLAYHAYSALCAAIAWGKAWHEYHYPSRIPLEQRFGFTAISHGENGITYIGTRSSQIPVPRVHNAKARHAAKQYPFA